MNTCLRCGHTWYPRGNWRTRNFTSVRCALCRSKYWNKPYVRNISQKILNPNSSFDAKLLPSHNAGILRSNKKPAPAVNENDGMLPKHRRNLESYRTIKIKDGLLHVPKSEYAKQLEIPADKYVHVKRAKLQIPGVVRSKHSPARFKISTRVKKPARVVSVKGLKHKNRKQNATKSKSGL
jgi:hypothetical protein